MVSSSSDSSDVVIAGAGIVGMCVAAALAERNLAVTLIGEATTGEASRAAAGMLAPSVERSAGSAHDFAVTARDRYPSYLEYLTERTGARVQLNREGVIQVALTERGVKGLRRQLRQPATWIDAAALASIEPALSHARGGVLNPFDGAVDNVALTAALENLVSNNGLVRRLSGRVTGVAARMGSVDVRTRDGARLSARFVVIAAGAWSAQIDGARLARVVTPLKGQLVSYRYPDLGHALYGPRGYLVPRGNLVIAGSTMEHTDFESATSEAGIAKVRSAAEEICPALSSLEPDAAWAGLRPVTPDMLPLLGPDPEHPEILYACGHSRNGILMAPMTGDIIADLVTASPLRNSLAQFRPDRF